MKKVQALFLILKIVSLCFTILSSTFSLKKRREKVECNG